MAKRYAVPPVPILEVTVQMHLDPNSHDLIIKAFRTVGLFEQEQVYSDKCSVPVDVRILNELEMALEGTIDAGVMGRWGIQYPLADSTEEIAL